MLSGGVGGPPARPNALSAPAERDVVDVVTSAVGQGALTAPTRETPVDQAGIAPEAVFRSDAEPLCDARAVPLDQHVGGPDESQRDLDAAGTLQVDADRSPPPIENGPRRTRRISCRDVCRLVDPHDVRSHVGQHEPAERNRPDARQLHDPHPVQRSGHAPPSRMLDGNGCDSTRFSPEFAVSSISGKLLHR